MIKYRVILKVGYYESLYEFENAEDAAKFATSALQHMVSTEDTDKRTFVNMQVVDIEAEKQEVEE